MKITKTNNISKKLTRGLIIGIAVSVAFTALITLILAFILDKSGKLPYSALDYITLAAGALGTFAGGYIAARIIKSSGLIVGAITGAVVFALTFIIGLTRGNGISLFALYRLSAYVFASLLGGILGVNKGDKIKIK